ncbi:MAG TPA: PAS domain S-box protein [Mesorhizobium sp.]|jgi:PAS domain S-box-containing protein|nr:PAS domain S-box protein [Mesorhizobium sp.]
MANADQMRKRQQVLADFGEFALRSDDLDAVLTEACRLLGEAMETGRAKVLEIENGSKCLFVRAGVGWAPDIVGRLRMPMGEHTSETFAIEQGKPVITQDIHKEDRFEVPRFMKEAGVVALVNVPLLVPGRKPYGLLQVDATEPRDFAEDDIQFLRTYATILGPVIDRLFKVQQLQAGEERFRLTVENARDYAIFLSDAEDKITDWFPGAEAVFGWTAEEIVGQPSAVTYTPEDREQGVPEQEAEIARRERKAPNVRWHMRKDGRPIFIEGSRTALRDERGSVHGFLKIGQDVTERRRSEERLHAAFSIGTVGVLFWGPGFHLTEVNDAFLSMTGFTREEALGKTWQDLTPPEFHEVSQRAVEEIAAVGECTPYEKQYFRKDGSRWWGLFTGRKVGDEVVEFALDVTERRKSEERLRESEAQARLLLAELQHRVRNTLAVVRSIARRTGATSETAEDYAMHLDGRINAFARVQAAVTRDPVAGVDLEMLVADELHAHGAKEGEQVTNISGPKVRLQPKAAETLGLVIHELTTNAVKYGALSAESGHLKVDWSFQNMDSQARLVLHWTETGVKLSGVGPRRAGFGTELIERTLAYDLGGEARLEFQPGGLRCTVSLPANDSIILAAS